MNDSKSGSNLPAYQMPPQYLDSNFWQRGPKCAKGEQSEKLIYIAVGHALSMWEHVESAASMLFGHFVDSNSIAAQRAYGSINGARARETALRQASETYFLLRRNLMEQRHRESIESMETSCKCFLRNYSLASARRNDIAHGVAYELSFKEASERSWFLVAPNYQSTRTTNWIEDDIRLRQSTGMKLDDPNVRFEFNKLYHSNSEYVYGANEIKVFAGKFAYFFADLMCFFKVMNPEKVKLSEDQLHQMARQMSQ